MVLRGEVADQRPGEQRREPGGNRRLNRNAWRRVRITRVAATSDITAATNADAGAEKGPGQDVDDERGRDLDASTHMRDA